MAKGYSWMDRIDHTGNHVLFIHGDIGEECFIVDPKRFMDHTMEVRIMYTHRFCKCIVRLKHQGVCIVACIFESVGFWSQTHVSL